MLKLPFDSTGVEANDLVRAADFGRDGDLVRGSGKAIEPLTVPKALLLRHRLRQLFGGTAIDGLMSTDALLVFDASTAQPDHGIDLHYERLHRLAVTSYEVERESAGPSRDQAVPGKRHIPRQSRT